MTNETSFTAKLGRKTYRLRLGHEEIYELETGAPWRDELEQRHIAMLYAQLKQQGHMEKPRGPIPKLFARLRSGEWTMPDVTQTIRLALIGGGLDEDEAEAVVARHVLDKPLAVSVQLAIAAVGAALVGRKEAAA